MVIEKTTAKERSIVQDVMWGMMGDLDAVQRMLGALWEDNFGMAKQESINECDAEIIGNTIRLCNDKIFDVLLQYALTVGDYSFRGVQPHLESAKHEADVIAVEKAIGAIRGKKRYMGGNGANASNDAQNRIEELPDDQALPLLEVMLEGAKP